MKKFLRRSALVILILAALIQFFRPDRVNPTADAQLAIQNQLNVPPSVLATLDRACFDCHSNQTRWPWYSAITPVNFLVARDVREGRRHLNFTEWGRMKPAKQQSVLEDIADEVTHGDMPLKIYLPLHPEARLSADDVKMINDWTNAVQDSVKEK